jgi:antitoxin component YwqK of YwqJK toxin-antitoxin module
MTFIKGTIDGKVTIWHDSGSKLSEGVYKDGKYDGLVVYWNPDGAKIGEAIHQEGVEKCFKEWSPTGELISNSCD